MLKTETVGAETVYMFPWQPNFSDGVDVSFTFRTVISKNKRHNEQRRGLVNVPFREIGASFQICELEAETFLNDIRSVFHQFLFAPVYIEPLTASSTITDERLFTNEDTSEYFHLRNFTEYCLGLDYSSKAYEVNKIDTFVGNNRIDFVGAWSEAFITETSVFYPCFFAFLNQKTSLFHNPLYTT